MFDPKIIKQDFPILSVPHPSGKPLCYLDSAATSQKPNQVIDAISEYYRTSNANVHRGIHFLGDISTRAWHESRKTVASFFGADADELILVRNTTEALNLVAYSLEESIHSGDVIISTEMEHHSNLIPWQQLAKRTGATLELIPVTPEGMLDLKWLDHRLQKTDDRSKVKIIAFTHVSNTLGTVNDIEAILARTTHNKSLITVIDGAQAAPHLPVDFHALGADFYAVSAHKMLGPMGVGGLFVKKEKLKSLKPWLFGGGMIDEVTSQDATWAEEPEDRFTAGTPDVAGIVGWAAACEYLSGLTMSDVKAHDEELVAYAIKKLSSIPEVLIVGPSKNRCGSVAFIFKGVHSHDVAQILDSEGVAVRSGHHCTMPLHTKMGWAATTRLSFNVYSTHEEIDQLVNALAKVKEVFHG